MTVDPAVLPGLLLLAAELIALAAVGFIVVRVALRQTDDRMALAQGLVVGPALWGLIVNFVMYAVPGLAGALVGWAAMLALGVGLAWLAPVPVRPQGRTLAGFAVVALAIRLGFRTIVEAPVIVRDRYPSTIRPTTVATMFIETLMVSRRLRRFRPTANDSAGGVARR